MNRRLFSKLSSDIDPAEITPWWKVTSLWGWMLIMFAVLSTFSFVLGAMGGETLFVLPSKTKSGKAIEASWDQSPILFVFLMTANAIVSATLWALFISWLRRRR